MTVQGKGGAGKSFVTALYSQHLTATGRTTRIFDIDAHNNTLTQFKALKAEPLALKKDGDERRIDERKFDAFMEGVFTGTEDVVICDVGASTLSSMMAYMVENDAFDMIEQNGIDVVFHIPVCGGQGLVDTVSGFKHIVKQVGTVGRVIVWLNPFHGSIEKDGKGFEEMKVYKDNSSQVSALVRLPLVHADTVGKDLETMMASKLTFAEVAASEDWQLMAKMRMQKYQGGIAKQLEGLGL